MEGLGLGLSGEAFLMAFDKSVPTALGLLGECWGRAGGTLGLLDLTEPVYMQHSMASRRHAPPPSILSAAIPFIVHPIDGAVHAVLNATLRPAMRRYICREAGGELAGLLICAGCRSSSSGSSSIDGDS